MDADFERSRGHARHGPSDGVVMQKLSDNATPISPNSFRKCQLCGFEKADICEFTMWWECDENDEIDPDKILITCKSEACQKAIDDHDRLYREIPWSQGGPGKFILLCGNCVNRNGTNCAHPKLKANGGDGLKVSYGSFLSGTIIRTDKGCIRFPDPACRCEGQIDLDRVLPDVQES